MGLIERVDCCNYLQGSVNRYRALFESVREGIFIQDFETGMIRDANPAVLALFGFSIEEIVGRKPCELTSIIKREIGFPIFKELHTKDHVYVPDLLLYNRQGRAITVDLNGQVRAIGEQKIIQITLHDMSAQRLWAEILDHSQIRYRRLFEAAQEGIMILDYYSGKIIDTNPFIANLIGFSFDELIGKELWEPGFIVDAELARKAYLELKSTGYIRYSPLHLRHKYGQNIPIEFVSYVYKVGDEKVIQCNLRDITDQRKVKEYETYISLIHKEMIHALTSMVEFRDSYTAGHQERVADLSVAIGKELHLSPSATEGLHLCSILHDIGKFNIPSEILIKQTELSDAEKDILRNHPQQGYNVLKFIHFPWPIAQTVLQHHERLDGSGYPNGLKGESISEEARIIGVADTVEAMTGERPYRSAIGIDKALQHIESESGRLFDPVIVEACVNLFHENKFSF